MGIQSHFTSRFSPIYHSSLLNRSLLLGTCQTSAPWSPWISEAVSSSAVWIRVDAAMKTKMGFNILTYKDKIEAWFYNSVAKISNEHDINCFLIPLVPCLQCLVGRISTRGRGRFVSCLSVLQAVQAFESICRQGGLVSLLARSSFESVTKYCIVSYKVSERIKSHIRYHQINQNQLKNNYGPEAVPCFFWFPHVPPSPYVGLFHGYQHRTLQRHRTGCAFKCEMKGFLKDFHDVFFVMYYPCMWRAHLRCVSFLASQAFFAPLIRCLGKGAQRIMGHG